MAAFLNTVFLLGRSTLATTAPFAWFRSSRHCYFANFSVDRVNENADSTSQRIEI